MTLLTPRSTATEKPLVSILLPVKNAGEQFDHVLRAIEQQRGVKFELIVVDSGSSDQTVQKVLELQKRAAFPVRVSRIKAQDFGHGKTRNFLAQQAHGEILVLLTHDASPMTPHYLRYITAPFEDKRVGLVFGPQRSRPDSNPIIRAELLAFFDGFAIDGKTTRYATRAAREVDRVGKSNDEVMRFSSDANAAIRRSAWQECAFRDVTYCEDQLIARDLLERGWHKVFEPRAAVYHSHNFGVVEFFRRYVDEWHGMFMAFDYIDVRHAWWLPGRVLRACIAIRHSLASDPRLSIYQKVLWYPRAAALATMRQLGGYIGPRLDRMPRWIKQRISREHHLLNA